ncbi:hypothetical protein CVN68_11650 [Sphingomonas psychrotolerans]|uniref:YD repeat-containing protein n=1 Tax=Sphingomonas psychrotolerans TaxID=1327635 RepID=A0A2K8MF90_9SPHN|nr:hypothetical protein CVN68_11650 [Sphingomonas psychrotolerans]
MTFRRFFSPAAAMALISLFASAAAGQEVTAYRYDALGRLVQTTISGGPANGISTGTCFDAAGNRAQHVVSSSGLPTCATQTSSLMKQLEQSRRASSAQGR